MGEQVELAGFYYVDIQMLRSASVGQVPTSLVAEFANVMCIKECVSVYPYFSRWCRRMLSTANLVAVGWKQDEMARTSLVEGDLCWVAQSFRCKGVGYWDIDDYRIGELYRRGRATSLSLFMDPRWVFSDNGHGRMRTGHITAAGLFQVAAANDSNRKVLGRPIILGVPATRLLKQLLPGGSFDACTVRT